MRFRMSVAGGKENNPLFFQSCPLYRGRSVISDYEKKGKVNRGEVGFYCGACSPKEAECRDIKHHNHWRGRGKIKCRICGKPSASHSKYCRNPLD